ncbi:MAG TPA: sugar phosphate isomerase/epimerase family protein [Bacteroidales bacterium]|mgnify:FL=1|nr:TIM barrel protein [Bacteroidales bacterium]HNR40597.1 sugar phosphate isomerase/epimerase family protein [Bacteroidales bacterium]
MGTTRRSFIAKSLFAAAGFSAGFDIKAIDGHKTEDSNFNIGSLSSPDPDAFRISIFSKHLQWLDYNGMAGVLSDLGFDGADLTVRPGGHVLPENVEADLPRAVEALAKKGKRVIMITTSVTDAADPLSEKILKTASSLGIKHYRTGYFHYNDRNAVSGDLARIREQLEKLANLNAKYSISGEYQNHSGDYGQGIYFGAPIWDLAAILEKINSPWLGSQYDVYHATVEGANAWPVGLRLISPRVRTIDIKDFMWVEKNGKTISEPVPLGQGMVDFKKFFSLLRMHDIRVPFSIHYEYPLGGAEHGNRVLETSRESVLAAIKKDLETLKGFLREAGLA